MILYPTPFLGWNTNYKGPINYIAMARHYVSTGPTVIVDLHYRVSADGLKWIKVPLSGDIALATRSGAGAYGAFLPAKLARLGSRLIAVGQLWHSPTSSRAAIFWADDARQWHRAETTLDGVKGSSGTRLFVDVTVFGSVVVALLNTGERAISSDGEAWTAYGNVGFSGSADALVAGTGVVVAGGAGGQAFSAANPASSFTARNAQAGSTRITHAVNGNVLLLAGNSYLGSSALNDGTGWTLRTDPVGGGFDWIGYGAGRWFGAGPSSKWITSVAGDVWTTPAEQPNSEARVWSGFHDGDRWLLFMSGGRLAVSDDGGESWDVDEDTGLANVNYTATLMAA